MSRSDDRRAHGCLRPYGFTANFWEKLGEIMVDVVLIQEAVRDLPGAGQAWVVLTACIVDQLRAGFDQAKEPFSKQSVTGPPPQCPAFHQNNSSSTGGSGWQNQQSFGGVGGSKKPSLQDEYYDDHENEHIYVNFPPEEEKQISPRCPYSNQQSSQQTSPQSPHRPVPTRQLPEEPITSIHRHQSFQLVVEHT
uniref:Uncharacterized protein n=1 Tax=Panagrolaimus sp. PS1159 TaxID=55785 RepID=A0AC35FUS7_9BILA